MYDIGHVADSLKEIRDCLKLDPEHKLCFPFYKKIKKIDKFISEAENAKEQNDFESCISNAQKILKNEKEVQMVQLTAHQLLCYCNLKDEKYTDAISSCNEALKIERTPYTHCDLADAYAGEGLYDDAVRSYHDALQLDENLSRAKEGIDRARRLQKQAEKRDYYQILGVKKSATKQEIVKAYRKQAQKW